MGTPRMSSPPCFASAGFAKRNINAGQRQTLAHSGIDALSTFVGRRGKLSLGHPIELRHGLEGGVTLTYSGVRHVG